MKAASIHELKNELNLVAPAKLLELCVRLAKYKKDNKELLSYLLFDAHDEAAFMEMVKKEMKDEFKSVNKTNLYFAKKSLRKILRAITKYIRYTGSKQVEVELLQFYCVLLKESGIAFRKNVALNNLYQAQLKKIEKLIATMHEDLQYDYLKNLSSLKEL